MISAQAAKMADPPTSEAALLPLIYNELQELKRKNAQLEAKLDSLAVPSGSLSPSAMPLGSPSSSLRRQSAGGLTPVDLTKPIKVPGHTPAATATASTSTSTPTPVLSSSSPGASSPRSAKIAPKDGTGLHVSQKTLQRIQEVEQFYADNRVILTTYPNQVRSRRPYSLRLSILTYIIASCSL